ncbi:DUF58 domain-containing protein [Pelagicoccus sp. SDUM812003]|uniref:DUF58 domain-containing protein n=1 Tax=Pelagicoccus sp. SDUM812003 TaxID=3041267 RepID=UPI00280F7524|nr:DUF58 domain-containing protein [Pelagicoccus sp. SDUM812003]MDQ8204021.1 DUF58 domain-containing protein [Pelagicoccus sp. SDUM812003]
MPSNPYSPTTSVDPEALLAIRDLELRARIVVEGIWAGLHRSPYHGFSVEFSEYRQYSPGDDLRYLDWKILARTDREYLKVFEDETNLRCLILADASKSMEFGSGSYSKFDYARTIAATLSYFLSKQRDVVGIARFDSAITDYQEPKWRPGHLKRLFALLERPAEGQATDLKAALEATLRLARRRSLVILISDFLSDPHEWSSELAYLRSMGHDVRGLQVLDPAEVNLHYGKAAYWNDVETGELRYVDPDSARDDYTKRFSERQRQVGSAFASAGARLQTITTDQPLDLALVDFVRELRKTR